MRSTTRPTLLVLGASLYQLPAIEAGKRLGYRVVATDNVPSNPGHRTADRSYDVDTTDMEGVLEVAAKEEVRGVIAPCTDVAVPTAAYVSERLGIPGPPLESARIACDKIAFRQFLQRCGFKCPEFFAVGEEEEPFAAISTNGQWVIKPDRSSGSKGAFIVASQDDYRVRLPETMTFSPGRRAVLEQYVQGHQGTCNGFLENGKLSFFCLLDRQTAKPPYVATWGHYVPTVLPTDLQFLVVSEIERVFRSLRIHEGPFDCDFIVSQDCVYILEVSPRIGGNSIAALVLESTGIDITEHAIRYACKIPRPIVSPQVTKPAAVILLGTEVDGRLWYDVNAVRELREESWVRRLVIDIEIGAPVQLFKNGRCRIGEAILCGNSRQQVESRAAEIRRRVSAEGR